MGDHKGSTIALVIINFLVFGGTAALIHLSAFPEHAGGVFLNEHRNLTSAYKLQVTPSDWTHLMWSAVFAWLLFAKLYTFVLLCRRNAVGPVYISPPVVTVPFLVVYTVSLLCFAAWVIVFDREFLIASVAVIGSGALIAWIATGIIYASSYRHGPWMARHAKVDMWLYRIFWHNGMAGLTTWTTIVFIYHLGLLLRYYVGLDHQTVVYVILGSISGLMILWFLLENTALDRFVRYTITPYAVIIHFMVGVYHVNYQGANMETSYFIVALLGVAVFCMVARLGLVILRGCRSPLYHNNKIGDDPVISFAA